ncbi:MAG: hypothetical protein OSJ58_13855 [Dysosmobacter sp.]|nr:hypothetical protein [Dysosmobacter sp.]
MNTELAESLYAGVIGRQVLRYVESLRPDELLPMVESEAMNLISEIKAILDDETTDDPECFHRIGAILNAYEERSVHPLRHDW